MVTAAPLIPLLLGQLVRHRIDPLITPLVGRIGGWVFGHQNPVLVRWPGGGWSTFEPEDTLIEVFRAPVGLCQVCHERAHLENDRFVVIPEAQQTEPRKVAHMECYQRDMESSC